MIETRQSAASATFSTPKRGKFPLGFVGALVVVALVEWGVVRPRADLSAFIASSWSESARAVEPGGEAIGAEVLCLGDSQVKGGVLPNVLEAQLGRPAYNLSAIGGQPALAYYLLKRALENGARPKALVIGFYPGLLASDLTINLRALPEALGARECLDLLRVAGTRKLAAPLLLRLALPTFRRRDEIRDIFHATLGGDSDTPERIKARAYRRNWDQHAGAQVLSPNPAFVDEVALPPGEPGASANGAGRRWKPKPVHMAYLSKLLDLARSRKIAVFWVLPTNSPKLRTLRASNGLDDAYYRCIQAMKPQSGSLTVLDPAPVLSDPKVFSDACHIDRIGAVMLSDAVARILAERLVPSAHREMQARHVVLEADPYGTAFAKTKVLGTLDESVQGVSFDSGSGSSREESARRVGEGSVGR
jgi:hypothetical protein